MYEYSWQLFKLIKHILMCRKKMTCLVKYRLYKKNTLLYSGMSVYCCVNNATFICRINYCNNVII